MKLGWQRLLEACIVALVLTLLACRGMHFFDALPGDRSSGLTEMGAYGTELQRENELNAELEANFRRVQEKVRIVQELIARRRTLREAADQFRDLTPRVQMDVLRCQNPGATDDVALCRNVLMYVEMEFERRHDQGWQEEARNVRRYLQLELARIVVESRGTALRQMAAGPAPHTRRPTR